MGNITMNRASIKFEEAKELLMKDAEFRSEYERLKSRYDVVSRIIEERETSHLILW